MLETPSIRRYSFMSHPVSRVAGMFSDNPTGAVNQQERPDSSGWMDRVPRDLGNWVAGFVDGEGSFNVPIRRAHDRGMPWRIGLSFNVSQLGPAAPQLLQSVFGCRTVQGEVMMSSTLKSPRSCSRGGGVSVLRRVSAADTQGRGSWRSFAGVSPPLVRSGRHLDHRRF